MHAETRVIKIHSLQHSSVLKW